MSHLYLCNDYAENVFILNKSIWNISVLSWHSPAQNIGAVTNGEVICRGHRSAVTHLINKTDQRIEELSTSGDSHSHRFTGDKTRGVAKPDNQIIYNTEVKDMDQEILDMDNFNNNME